MHTYIHTHIHTQDEASLAIVETHNLNVPMHTYMHTHTHTHTQAEVRLAIVETHKRRPHNLNIPTAMDRYVCVCMYICMHRSAPHDYVLRTCSMYVCLHVCMVMDR